MTERVERAMPRRPMRPLWYALTIALVAGCANKPRPADIARSNTDEVIRFGPARDEAPGTFVIHQMRFEMHAKMALEGAEEATRVDAYSHEERRTEVIRLGEYLIGWKEYRTRTVINGEKTVEVNPLEGHTFHVVWRAGHYIAIDDGGVDCISNLCKSALSELATTVLAARKPKPAAPALDAPEQDPGSVLSFDAPMSIGQHFDDASALIGPPTVGMSVEGASATLESVDKGVARFTALGTLRFTVGGTTAAVKFKGKIARRISDRAITEDSIAGPLTVEVKTENGTVVGRGNILLAEKFITGP